jgi:hypothetical protein
VNRARLFGRFLVAVAAFALAGGIADAQATPLDKLIGKSLSVGNLVFSNFSAPSFVGVGPSAIDVQTVVATDPDTGLQSTGLRFVAPLSQSPSGGPHEIVLNVNFFVTDMAGLLDTIHHSTTGSASGQAVIYNFTIASPAPGSLTHTYLQGCIPAAVCAQLGGPTPSSLPLFADTHTLYVEQQVQLIIANRKGGAGTTSLQQFEVLFTERP